MVFVVLLFVFITFNKYLDNDMQNTINKILSKHESISPNGSNYQIENFTDSTGVTISEIEDKQNIINNPYNISKTESEQNNYITQVMAEQTAADTIQKPSVDLVYKTPEQRGFVTSADFGWSQPTPVVSCANSSIDSKYKLKPKNILPYQISCGMPNKLTAENWYKTHFDGLVANLEEYGLRGSNYDSYSGFTQPSKLAIRILSRNTKGLPEDETRYRNIPSGFNYAFHNTPAMAMP